MARLPTHSLLTFLLAVAPAWGQQMYIDPDLYVPSNFFSKFFFNPLDDPTHGYVDYQTFDQATSAGLAQTFPTYVQFGADGSPVGARGRKSVRLESLNRYNHGLIVADIKKMPNNACGMWPAYWMLGPDWPVYGEIDIVEGVNFEAQNHYTLHSSGPTGTCDLQYAPMNGTLDTTECSVEDENGTIVNPGGCSIASGSQQSLMNGFNSVDGGVVVTQWTSTYIKNWIFPRDNIPPSLLQVNSEPNVCEFGRPDSTFYGCDFDRYFQDQQIIISLTFCGDYAANPYIYPGTCPDTCVNMVANHTDQYTEAYWQWNSLRVWNENPAYTGSFDTPVCSADPATTSSTTTTTGLPTTTIVGFSTSTSFEASTLIINNNYQTNVIYVDPSTLSTVTGPAAAPTSGFGAPPLGPDPNIEVVTGDPQQPGNTGTTVAPAAPASNVSPDESCGPANGYVCPTGQCCSEYGYCGNTDAYCGAGCMPAFGTCSPIAAGSGNISPDSTCGANGYSCPAGECCSQWGYCGTSNAYCGFGCQIGFSGAGTCVSDGGTASSMVGQTTDDGSCGGLAGMTCNGDALGGCCSQYGYCGNTVEYCGAGCQPAFGTCF